MDASYKHGFNDGLARGHDKAMHSNVSVIMAEMALYGVNLTLSIVAVTVLRRRGAVEGAAHRRLFLLLMLMLTIATTYVTLNVVETFTTSSVLRIRYDNSLRSLILVQVVLGNSVAIWRCYVIYGRSPNVVVLPALTALASFALGLYLVSSEVTKPRRSRYEHRFAEPMVAWDDQSWKWAATTVACTTYCAAAISYRICSCPHLAKGTSLPTTISVVTETSFLHTLGVIAYLLATIFIRSPHAPVDVRFPLMGIIVQLPSIALCLLIFRIKYCSNTSQPVQYTERELAANRTWSAVRRTGRIREAGSDDGEMEHSRVAPATVHDLTRTMSPAHSSRIDGMSHTDDMDTNSHRKKDTYTASEIA